jgi:hypothetical protein
MTESTDDGELERSMILMRVINKNPRLFSKWVDLKEKFAVLDWADARASTEPPFFIADALKMINEAFDNDDRQLAVID